MRPSGRLADCEARVLRTVLHCAARGSVLHLGGTTCLTLYLSTTASFVLGVFRRVKDHHNSLQYSSLLKNICVRQVVLDKWLPLNKEWGFWDSFDILFFKLSVCPRNPPSPHFPLTHPLSFRQQVMVWLALMRPRRNVAPRLNGCRAGPRGGFAKAGVGL